MTKSTGIAGKISGTKIKTEPQADHEYRGGDKVRFTGYSIAMKAGEEPILSKDESLRVTKVNDDGGLVCVVLTKDDKVDEKKQGDTVFPEEVELVTAAPRGRKRTAAKTQAKTSANKEPPTLEAEVRNKELARATETQDTETPVEAEAPASDETRGDAVESILRGEIDHIDEVAKIIRTSNNIPGTIETKVSQRHRKDFLIAGLIYHVRENKHLLNKDFGDEENPFEAWAEYSLGFGRDKAFQWAKIYRAFRGVGLGAEEFEAVGWAKAIKICRLTPKVLAEHKDWLVKTARESTIKELKEAMVQRGLILGGEPIDKTKFKFTLLGDAAHTAQRAITEAKQKVVQQANVDANDNRAFEWICGEWSNLTEGADRSLEAEVDSVVRRHHLQAVADYVQELTDAAEADTPEADAPGPSVH